MMRCRLLRPHLLCHFHSIWTFALSFCAYELTCVFLWRILIVDYYVKWNCFMDLQFCGGKTSEGVFVGLFLSMSSTAMVCLCYYAFFFGCTKFACNSF